MKCLIYGNVACVENYLFIFFSERMKRKMLINCRELGGGLSLRYRLEHLSCKERARDRDSCSLEMRSLQGHLTAVFQSKERETSQKHEQRNSGVCYLVCR